MSARALLVLALLLVPARSLAQVEVVIVSHEGPSEHVDRARLRASAFAQCRETGAAGASDLVVRVALAIARDGSVATITLADAGGPALDPLRSCALERAVALRFAPGEVRHVELLIRARRAEGAAALGTLDADALAALAPAIAADATPDYTAGRVPSVSRGRIAAVEGTLTRAVLERILARHLQEVQFCYQHALQAHGALASEGEIVVQLLVSARGEVAAASIASDEVGDPDVAACIVQAARAWTFPAPEGGQPVQARARWTLRHRPAPPWHPPHCSGGGCGF